MRSKGVKRGKILASNSSRFVFISERGAYATGRLEHSGRKNDEKMLVRLGMHSLAPQLFHSAVLSLPGVLLRKLPVGEERDLRFIGQWRGAVIRMRSLTIKLSVRLRDQLRWCSFS